MTASPARLVVGTFSPSVVLRTARRTGVLEAHGLAVEERAVPSSPAQFRALADGELQAALTSPDNVLAYRFLPDNPLGGIRDVRIVAAVDRGLGLALYADDAIGSLANLRGRVVGVDVAASGFAFALLEILGRAGLTAGDDYELVELGSTPKRLQALLDGRCAATMLNADNALRADDAGLRRLADVSAVAAPYLGTVLAVEGSPASAVRSLAAALRETAASVLSGQATGAAVAESAAMGLPPALAERYLELLVNVDQGLVADGAVDQASLASVIALRQRHMAPERGVLLEGALEHSSGLVDAADG